MQTATIRPRKEQRVPQVGDLRLYSTRCEGERLSAQRFLLAQWNEQNISSIHTPKSILGPPLQPSEADLQMAQRLPTGKREGKGSGASTKPRVRGER